MRAGRLEQAVIQRGFNANVDVAVIVTAAPVGAAAIGQAIAATDVAIGCVWRSVRGAGVTAAPAHPHLILLAHQHEGRPPSTASRQMREMARGGRGGRFNFTTITAVFLSCRPGALFTFARRVLGSRPAATSTERDIRAVPSHNQCQGHR
jgi:hypothetical protein